MEQVLDFSKERVLKIKVTRDGKEEILSLRYPKVRDTKEMAAKSKGLAEDDPKLGEMAFDFLEKLGLPKECSEELEPVQVKQIMDVLTGGAIKK